MLEMYTLLLKIGSLNSDINVWDFDVNVAGNTDSIDHLEAARKKRDKLVAKLRKRCRAWLDEEGTQPVELQSVWR